MGPQPGQAGEPPKQPRTNQRTGALEWTAEELANTPSRAQGIQENEERQERFAACVVARDMIRMLFDSADSQAVDRQSKVQVLACYYLQLFYMFRSLQQEDSKVVAVAAAFLACKVVDAPRRMSIVLRTYNQLRSSRGDPELTEEEQQKVRNRILQVEFLLLRIISFDFDPVLPFDEVEGLADRMLARLTLSQAFRDACTTGQGPQAEAKALRPRLLQVAANFMRDAFMGLAPLVATPRVIAAGALAVAVRYARREMSFNELCALHEQADKTITQQQVKLAIEEIMNVFRMNVSKVPAAKAAQPATAAPGAAAAAAGAAPGAVAAPGPATAAAVPALGAGRAPVPTASSGARGAPPRPKGTALPAVAEPAPEPPAAAGTSGESSASAAASGPIALASGSTGAQPPSTGAAAPGSGQEEKEKEAPARPRQARRAHPYAKPGT